MALSDYNHEDGSAYNYMGYHSPCINPAHYYYKGGIYLHMIDYFTGYDYIKNVWFYNLPGSFDFWERHYNQNGTKIMPTLENGCYDRLSMAKKGIQELVDMIAAQNAESDRRRTAFPGGSSGVLRMNTVKSQAISGIKDCIIIRR